MPLFINEEFSNVIMIKANQYLNSKAEFSIARGYKAVRYGQR